MAATKPTTAGTATLAGNPTVSAKEHANFGRWLVGYYSHGRRTRRCYRPGFGTEGMAHGVSERSSAGSAFSAATTSANSSACQTSQFWILVLQQIQ